MKIRKLLQDILDVPSHQKNQYPYPQKNQEGIDENVKENTININIDEDDLFILIINNSFKISEEFYEVLERLDLLYTETMLSHMKQDKIQMLKDIIYTLYILYSGNFVHLLLQVSRESLINLYLLSLEHNPNDLLNYYRRSLINKYTNNST